MPQGIELRLGNSLLVLSEAATIHRKRLRDDPTAFSPIVQKSLAEGVSFSAIDYAQVVRTQRTAQRQFEHFFQTYDILLTPTTLSAVYAIITSEEQCPSLTCFTSAWNFLGLPALSLPCSFTHWSTHWSPTYQPQMD